MSKSKLSVKKFAAILAFMVLSGLPALAAEQQVNLSPNANPATKALFGQGVITCADRVEQIRIFWLRALGGSIRVADSAVIKASLGSSTNGDATVGAGVAYSW